VDVPDRFERDTGGTPQDWLRWLPGACGSCTLNVIGLNEATVELASGTLALNWQVLPHRRIGLVKLPRLNVAYRFDGVDVAERQAFMRHFDRHMQRGGG
jgi:hypothetical protein